MSRFLKKAKYFKAIGARINDFSWTGDGSTISDGQIHSGPMERHATLHILVTDGCFGGSGAFYAAAANPLARLLKKIYEVDPLTCSKCGGSMRIIAFIEDYKVIKKILDWLGIDEFKRDWPPPKKLQATDLFDDFTQDDYINADYSDF